MNRAVWWIVLAILPVGGAIRGRWAGPGLARAHRTVRLADRIRLEDGQGIAERTLASAAFRATGRPSRDLYREAAAIERTFEWGTALLGVWIGLVVIAKLWGATRVRPTPVAVIDRASCVSCARCFAWCPRERLRWKGTPQP